MVIPAAARGRDRSGEPGDSRPNPVFQLCRLSQVVSRNLFTHAAGCMALKTKELEQLRGICQWIYIIAGNNSINYSALSLTKHHSYPCLGESQALCERTFGGEVQHRAVVSWGVGGAGLGPCELSEPQRRLGSEKVEAAWVLGRVSVSRCCDLEECAFLYLLIPRTNECLPWARYWTQSWEYRPRRTMAPTSGI